MVTKKICIVLIAILLVWLNLVSCKKEYSCENCRGNNNPPPPPPPPPPSPTNSCNSNRPHVNAQLIPIGSLSQARWGISVASADNKILFAGGLTRESPSVQHSSRVDIYNLITQTWSIAELCSARADIATVTNGNKIFFGGGEVGDGDWPVDSVDIYDASANSWSTSHLSIAGQSIAGAAVGNKVLFAGGVRGLLSTQSRETRVDIFNLTTGTWSTSQLSELKIRGHAAIAVGNKIYVGGGVNKLASSSLSRKIDIYNNDDNTWSVDSLTESKTWMGAIAVGQKIYWAGGYTDSGKTCMVEIMDLSTGNRTLQYLSRPVDFTIDDGDNAVLKDRRIIFIQAYGSDSDKFDIYDIASNSWSIGVLPQPIPIGASIISVNNTIYIAGGEIGGNVMNLSNKVYKLQF